MSNATVVALCFSAVLVGGAFLFTAARSAPEGEGSAASTAAVVDGVQVVDIAAKGGYAPRVVVARAGIPTTLRVQTSGTFDCSASLVIPALSYRKFLPPSGVEEIFIPTERAQGTLRGLCSMGMYNFRVEFE